MQIRLPNSNKQLTFDEWPNTIARLSEENGWEPKTPHLSGFRSAFKQNEMAIRRAFALNRWLIRILNEGGLEAVRRRPFEHHDKDLKFALGDQFWQNPIWKYKDVWNWTVDHWWSGALKRSVDDLMYHTVKENRDKIKEKDLAELYAG